MNKQEYLKWRRRKRRILADRRIAILGMAPMFAGIALASITPPPWNALALLAPYLFSIGMMILIPEIASRGQEEASAFVKRAVEAYNE